MPHGPEITNDPIGSKPCADSVSSATPNTGIPSILVGISDDRTIVGSAPISGRSRTPLSRSLSASTPRALVCSTTLSVPPSTAICASWPSTIARPGADCSSSTSRGAPSSMYWLGSPIRSTMRREMFAATALGTAFPRSAVMTVCTPSVRPSPRMRMNMR